MQQTHNSMTLTVGPQEGRRKEALVHQAGEGNDPDHVVGVKGQATERLTAQLLWSANRGATQTFNSYTWPKTQKEMAQ